MPDREREFAELREQNAALVTRNNELLAKTRLQSEVAAWCDGRHLKLPPKFPRHLDSRWKKLAEEVAELFATIHFPDMRKDLPDELGDVLVVLMDIAGITGVDALECGRMALERGKRKHGG